MRRQKRCCDKQCTCAAAWAARPACRWAHAHVCAQCSVKAPAGWRAEARPACNIAEIGGRPGGGADAPPGLGSKPVPRGHRAGGMRGLAFAGMLCMAECPRCALGDGAQRVGRRHGWGAILPLSPARPSVLASASWASPSVPCLALPCLSQVKQRTRSQMPSIQGQWNHEVQESLKAAA